jgi:ATP-dependent exoDNAse (exonuclease V) beta subunit
MPAAARAQTYLSVFLTAKGERRNRIVTGAFAAKHGELAGRLDAEQARLEPLVPQRRAVLARDRTAAALTVAEAVIRRYRREKENRGLLDYDDLIAKSLVLLANVEAAWVHYKLDLGIDHVLIDEAQDTSAPQWEIICRLVSEFTAGEGVRQPQTRSIFAVGDEKQSIFSFQGAVPEKFADMARHFAARHRDAELAFRHCKFQFSFRSGLNVLGAVDTVFAGFRRTSPCRERRRASSRSGRRSRRRRRPRSRRGTRRSTNLPSPIRRRSSPSVLQPRSVSCSIGAAAPATSSSWCASAGPCSRRSFARSRTPPSRLRAPTGWC